LEDVKGSIIKELKSSRGMQSAYIEAKKAHDIIYQEDNIDIYGNKNNLKIHDVDFFPINAPPQEFTSIKDFPTILLECRKTTSVKSLLPEMLLSFESH